jgi:hypothetical protein
VSRWGEFFLGIIAVSTLVTSVVLVALLVAAGRLARRIERLTGTIEQELAPLFGHLTAMARDAAHAASVAGGQMDRLDRVVGDLLQRVEEVSALLGGLFASLQRGSLVAAGAAAFRSVFEAIRAARAARPRRRKDDEDALFI